MDQSDPQGGDEPRKGEEDSNASLKSFPMTPDLTSTSQVNGSDDADEEDDTDMPPLEEIDQELKASPHGRNIKGVATEDDPTGGDGDDAAGTDDDDDEPEESKDGWVDILNNGDLRKKTLKKADTPYRAVRGAKATIRLVTRLYQGSEGSPDPAPEATGPVVPDESHERLSIIIGDNDLHQGLDLLLPLMDLGETARLLIKPRFGYGPSGNKAVGIPGDTILDLEVELLDITKYDDDPLGGGSPLGGASELEPGEPNPIVAQEPLEERIRFGNYKKIRGNFWFERGEYSLAIQCYRGAIKFLDASEDELAIADRVQRKDDVADADKAAEVEDLLDKRAQTFNNLAAAQLKLQAYDSALKSVEAALLLRPENTKALYRRAKIRAERGDLEEAIADLKTAARLDPQSEAIAQELDRMNKILARQMKEQRQMYRRMMQVKDDSPESTESQKSASSSSPSPARTSNSKQSKSKQTTSLSTSASGRSAVAAGNSKYFSWLPSRLSPTTTLTASAGALVAAILIPTLYLYFK